MTRVQGTKYLPTGQFDPSLAVIPFGLKLCTGRWESLLTVMMIAAALLSIIGGYAVGPLLKTPEAAAR